MSLRQVYPSMGIDILCQVSIYHPSGFGTGSTTGHRTSFKNRIEHHFVFVLRYLSPNHLTLFDDVVKHTASKHQELDYSMKKVGQ